MLIYERRRLSRFCGTVPFLYECCYVADSVRDQLDCGSLLTQVNQFVRSDDAWSSLLDGFVAQLHKAIGERLDALEFKVLTLIQ